MGSTGVVITVRRNSSRLPDKCLQLINGREALAILLENVSRQNRHPVIVATRENPHDDPIVEIAERYGARVYRGQDESPLHRLYAVAIEHGLENVVRITADDILIDARLMLMQIADHVARNRDYTTMWRVPSGFSGEVIRTSALARIVGDEPDSEIEHVSYWLKRSKYAFHSGDFAPPREYHFSDYRLTLDYFEDLQVLRIVLGQLNGQVSTLDILNLLKGPAARSILAINRMPQITVYTCCHNQGRYLRECLDSVFASEYDDFELIIIDDASTDNTASVALDWTSRLSDRDRRRVRIYRNEENIGLPASSNKALHLAKGRYVVRVDSDDVISSSFLGKAKRFLDEHHEFGALFTSHYEADESMQITKTVQATDHTHPGCCMYRTKLARDLLYLEDLPHYEGLEFFKRFSKAYDYGRMNVPLWTYRKHKESKSATPSAERVKIKARIDGQEHPDSAA